MKFLFCSDCFNDFGLRKTAQKIGSNYPSKCHNCGSRTGLKISKAKSEDLVVSFFWNGSLFRTEYGGAHRLVSNPYRYGENLVEFPEWLKADALLIQETLKIGIFHYGPPLWRIGEIVPLQRLRDSLSRARASRDIVARYRSIEIDRDYVFHRLRLNLESEKELDPLQYDSPPDAFLGVNRLDSKDMPVMYGSPDLEICLHECRVTIPDECFVAHVRPIERLKLLNLCVDIEHDGATEFDSINLAMHFLFQAPKHSYPITRAIASAARESGYDGIMYPSYFSTLKESKVPNIGLFGRPIRDNRIEIVSINRAHLKAANYDYQLGPLFA
jgi:RES domain